MSQTDATGGAETRDPDYMGYFTMHLLVLRVIGARRGRAARGRPVGH
ncbi:hypothetical protein [Jannaschia helgolandensis]